MLTERTAFTENRGGNFTVCYTYDYAGRILSAEKANGQIDTRTYDWTGNQITATDYSGNQSNYTYDALGRIIIRKVPFESTNDTVAYAETRYTYDQNGNIIRERVANNEPGSALSWRTTDYEYDSRDRLIMVTSYNSSNPVSYVQYYYDGAGNVLRQYTGLTSPLAITGLDNVSGEDSEYSVVKYTYDLFSRLTMMTDPIDQQETYYNDINGNIISKTDRNGNTINYEYDELGRLTRTCVTTADGSEDVFITYTKTGLKKNESNNTGTVSYAYDSLGRVTQEIVNSSTGSTTVKTFGYDLGNNRTYFTVTTNGMQLFATTYVYDNLGRLITMSEGGTTAEYGYDTNGNRSYVQYNNGLRTDYTFNLSNLVKTLTNKKAEGTVLSQYLYQYTVDGNQTQKQEMSGKTTAYSYDGLGRLTSEATTDGGQTQSYLYTYDDSGNRQSLTATGTESYVTSYTYDANNRLMCETQIVSDSEKTTRYYYDPNGNQISKTIDVISPSNGTSDLNLIEGVASSELYRYNGFNQLVQVQGNYGTIEYSYYPSGLRAAKASNGVQTTFILDGGNVILEKQNGNVTAKYVRALNLVSSTIGNVESYYLYNAHGDVVQLVNASGVVSKTYNYDAFGIEINLDPNDVNPFRYCGEYFDLSSGTYYLSARYYNPTIGRFLSEDTHWNTSNMIYGDDPLMLNKYTKVPDIAAITQSSNLYVYCGNNPIIYVDSDGHIFMLVTAAIGAVVGGAAGAIYSYAKTGSVTWQSVATGAAIGGAIGLTGGAAASLLATAGSATGVTALASTSTVLSGLGVVGGAGGTIVIGQTMSRVIEKAESIGASYYEGCKYYEKLSNMFGSNVADFIGKADNALWIINKMAQDFKIVDIGINVNKALGNSSYTLESILTFFYKNKEIAIEYFKGAL